MNNMQTYARRTFAIHGCVSVFLMVATGVVNYIMWTYTPDTRFETLETLFLPFVRPVVSIATVAMAVVSISDPHTIRVLRKLAHYLR